MSLVKLSSGFGLFRLYKSNIRQWYGRLSKCTALTTLGFSLFFVPHSFADEQSSIVYLDNPTQQIRPLDRLNEPASLRGSEVIVQDVKGYDKPVPLRTAIYVDDAAVYEEDSESTFLEPNVFRDLRDTTGFIFKNNVFSLFRGSTDAVADRGILPFVPDRPSLRNAIMLTLNQEDLRGGGNSIGDSVAAALRGSYTARSVLHRANAEKSNVYSALANFFPRVSGTLTAQSATSTVIGAPTDPIDTSSGSIEITVPLFTSGVNLNSYKQAAYLSLAADDTYLAEEHRVTMLAIAAHVNLSLNRKIEWGLAKNARAILNIVTATKELFEAGEASLTDVAVAEANYENARSDHESARRLRMETQNEYESLTGRKAPKHLALPKFSSVVPNNVEAAVEIARRNNPTLSAAYHTATASKHAAKAAFGRYGPQINLSGSYQREFSRSSADTDTDNWAIGVNLTVPLFDATMAPTVTSARSSALEAQFRALDQGREIELQVRGQWGAYKSSGRRVAILSRQARADKRRVIGSRKEFEAGLRALDDVITDQIRYARTQITLERARHERILSAYQLAVTTAHPAIQQIALGR